MIPLRPLRHVVYEWLLTQPIGRIAVDSHYAPWAAMLCQVVATRRLTASAARRSRPTLQRSLSWSHPSPLPPLDLDSVTLPPSPQPPGAPPDPIDERFPRRKPRRRRSFA